jgi:hypothetical protein
MGECDEEIKKVEAERDAFIQFIQYLKEDHPAFADAFDKSGDLIGTHEGFFGYWDDVIEACGGGSYGHSPLELIGVIRIALEESEAELDKALKELERVDKECDKLVTLNIKYSTEKEKADADNAKLREEGMRLAKSLARWRSEHFADKSINQLEVVLRDCKALGGR